MRNQVLCLKTIGALAAQGRSMVMTTHDPNHAFLYPGRVVLMKPDGSLLTGPASDVITDTTLSMIYGTDVGVFCVAGRASTGQFKFCSPWH
jgi:iron complex transport system ATP-binding protein